MLRYQDIASKDKDLLAMTGYTQQEFMALLPQFQQSYDDYSLPYRKFVLIMQLASGTCALVCSGG